MSEAIEAPERPAGPAGEVPKRNNTHAFGVVLLKDWMPNPETSQGVNQVAGPIQLITAKEFGFQPKGNETNWGVRVGTEEKGVLVLGCQIRGIYWGEKIRVAGDGVNCWVL